VYYNIFDDEIQSHQKKSTDEKKLKDAENICKQNKRRKIQTEIKTKV
jgi:hypothetical protein